MDNKPKTGIVPVAWLFYLIIVFEIVYMISPFALYYYSVYGPGLNLLHYSPATAWLSGFFLPHFTASTSWTLNHLSTLGGILSLAGLALFLAGAGQIYHAKFTRKGAVTGGLYRWVRHPQYTAFSILGLGLLLIWPRFAVLVMYVTMLFIYQLLAEKEEQECEDRFGEAYRTYQESTGRFIPKRLSLARNLPPSWRFEPKRPLGRLFHYLAVMAVCLTTAFWARNLSVNRISTYYSRDAATISTVLMSETDIEQILRLALEHPQVKERVTQAGYGAGTKLLNYIVPLDWRLADLPLEPIPKGTHGHHQPVPFDRDRYKLLLTEARLFSTGSVTGADIVKRTYAREPLLVVKINRASGKILELDTPPLHVKWGDISTPLF